ncbi:MAG: heavy-metal-associated domain-containing protein [Clostridiaceae bacterium]|nr:heavy-metal-associated domain-containing protein [Clostridiaceae bacterium]
MKKKLIIEGMSCRHCVNHITEVLEDIPGVESVVVDLQDMSAEVETSRDISEEEFRLAIDEAGYELVDVI